MKDPSSDCGCLPTFRWGEWQLIKPMNRSVSVGGDSEI